MKLAIYGRVYKKEYQKQLQNLFDFLHQNEISFLVEESFLIQCKQAEIKIKETDSFDGYVQCLIASHISETFRFLY